MLREKAFPSYVCKIYIEKCAINEQEMFISQGHYLVCEASGFFGFQLPLGFMIIPC